MKRKSLFVLIVVAVMAVAFLAGIAQAEDKMATPAQAKELLKKAVAYTKEAGYEKAIAAFNDTKGSFAATYKNAYVTVGRADGITVGNGRYPFLVGQNHMGVKDADGKPFIKVGWDDLKKSGHASVQYKWLDPKTKNVETRTLISELVDCGAPQGKISVSVTYEGKM
jgi:cytochrome c